jgi:hypothetical protein
MTNVLADIGGVALPPATAALRDFSEALKLLNGILPKPDGKDKSEDATTKIGAAVIKGAAIGAIAGSILPGPGTLGGAALGGALFGGLKASQKQFGTILQGRQLAVCRNRYLICRMTQSRRRVVLRSSVDSVRISHTCMTPLRLKPQQAVTVSPPALRT